MASWSAIHRRVSPGLRRRKKALPASTGWDSSPAAFAKRDHGLLAMAANKMRTPADDARHHYRYRLVVSIVWWATRPSSCAGRYPRHRHNTIDVYPGKDFGDDEPQYQQALKYDDLAAIQKQPWVNSATPAVRRTCVCAWATLTWPPALTASAETTSTSTA